MRRDVLEEFVEGIGYGVGRLWNIRVGRRVLECVPTSRRRLVGRLGHHLFEAGDLIGLRAFGALDDVELDFVSFFETLVAFALDGAVVNEHVGTPVTAEKTVSLCVVEPLYGAFVLCQLSQLLLASISS
jgi:hypothetical protein